MGIDVVYNKAQIIERCLQRVYEEYEGNPDNLANFTKQDSIILNIQRSCEAAIDLAMHLVAELKLGLPQNSRDAFTMLHNKGIIDDRLAQAMQAMVGFRNIAVHDYQAVNLDIVRAVIEKHLVDLKEFVKVYEDSAGQPTPAWAKNCPPYVVIKPRFCCGYFFIILYSPCCATNILIKCAYENRQNMATTAAIEARDKKISEDGEGDQCVEKGGGRFGGLAAAAGGMSGGGGAGRAGQWLGISEHWCGERNLECECGRFFIQG
mgnify:CR=1 FL=1